jgi:uncharacterized protein (DUF302 family)
MVNKQGLVQIPSRYSVEETLQRLELAFATRRLQVFARVDHSGEAEKAGMKMRPTKLLIFGSPKAGTPLYNSPEYLRERHGVPSELINNLTGAGALMEKAVE